MRCNGCRARSCINAFVVLRTAEQAVSCHFDGAHSVKSQHSRGLQPRRASCRKNRTGTRAGARMPTIGSKPVPLAPVATREREGSSRASRGPTSLGMWKCLGRSRSFRATPRDRYISVTTVTAVSRVVSQKSNFQKGSIDFEHCHRPWGGAPSNFPAEAVLWNPLCDPLSHLLTAVNSHSPVYQTMWHLFGARPGGQVLPQQSTRAIDH